MRYLVIFINNYFIGDSDTTKNILFKKYLNFITKIGELIITINLRLFQVLEKRCQGRLFFTWFICTFNFSFLSLVKKQRQNYIYVCLHYNIIITINMFKAFCFSWLVHSIYETCEIFLLLQNVENIYYIFFSSNMSILYNCNNKLFKKSNFNVFWPKVILYQKVGEYMVLGIALCIYILQIKSRIFFCNGINKLYVIFNINIKFQY
eukprot:TRINITY_DN3335_c0_g1_i4.p2 TRINITY_DN3335_c0_g1~~TRINITY_DN3335_c0_g1_i4.p2  ORF type:complete len:206 (-),score=-16.00 TRINITY_DN3335_c0_g1_i4:362-979(-)